MDIASPWGSLNLHASSLQKLLFPLPYYREEGLAATVSYVLGPSQPTENTFIGISHVDGGHTMSLESVRIIVPDLPKCLDEFAATRILKLPRPLIL